MTDALSQYSVLSLYSAMAIYAIAFVLFTIELASKATEGKLSAKFPRMAMALTWIAFVLQLAATVMRGFAASRVPWANMYEFSMTGTLIIVGVFLFTNLKWNLRFLGAFITGLVLILLGLAATRYYVEVVPLPPALQSYWLVIHVFVATLATGFFALGFGLSLLQLLQQRRETAIAGAKKTRLGSLVRLPDAVALENYAYRLIIIGFIFWTFTLIAGAIWADKAWGRYWGWDTKEVWTFIIWTIYAGYLHANATRGWTGKRLSLIQISEPTRH